MSNTLIDSFFDDLKAYNNMLIQINPDEACVRIRFEEGERAAPYMTAGVDKVGLFTQDARSDYTNFIDSLKENSSNHAIARLMSLGQKILDGLSEIEKRLNQDVTYLKINLFGKDRVLTILRLSNKNECVYQGIDEAKKVLCSVFSAQ